MAVHNFDEVSPLVITPTVSGNTLTLMVTATTLGDYDWVRDDIASGSSSVEIQVPDPAGYEMSVSTEGEASAWSRTGSSPFRCYRTVTLASMGDTVSLAVNLTAVDSSTRQPTAVRRQTIILKRKST